MFIRILEMRQLPISFGWQSNARPKVTHQISQAQRRIRNRFKFGFCPDLTHSPQTINRNRHRLLWRQGTLMPEGLNPLDRPVELILRECPCQFVFQAANGGGIAPVNPLGGGPF
jgi:hypothetical protein